MRLLSTKIISHFFKERLVLHQFSVVEKAFIEVRPTSDVAVGQVAKNVIFTSQNAVNIAFKNEKIRNILEDKFFFCVGKKTKALLAKNGKKAIKIADKSSELADFISKNNKNDEFSFFCSGGRLPDLERILSTNDIKITPIILYNTLPRPHVIKGHFDGVLFFSPSTVRSYAMKNTFKNTHSFCLGPSTAKEVENYTENFSVAKIPEDAQMLLIIKNYFKKGYE